MTTSIEHLALFNQIIRLSRVLEAKLMQELLKQGFDGLTMSFADPMMIITLGPVRMNELADELGMSKQLCNQSLKPLEQLNLIQRLPDPEDGRAKLVSLTARGEELALAAQAIIAQLQDQITDIIGQNNSRSLHTHLYKLAQHTNLRVNELVPTTGIISLLSRYTQRELMRLTMQQGFGFLQLSYSQVLNYISPQQTAHISLSELAQINHISLQAISRISRELEHNQVITKTHSSIDKRVKVIQLTELGEKLYESSIRSAQILYTHYENAIGNSYLASLTQQLIAINQHADILINVKISENDERSHTAHSLTVQRVAHLLKQANSKKLDTLAANELKQLQQLLIKL